MSAETIPGTVETLEVPVCAICGRQKRHVQMPARPGHKFSWVTAWWECPDHPVGSEAKADGEDY